MSVRFTVSYGCIAWSCEDCGTHGYTTGADPADLMRAAQRDATAHACAPDISIDPVGAALALASVNDTIRAAYALHGDPAREILLAIREPLGLPEASLPAYGKPGKDDCAMCLGPHRGGGLCLYCGTLKTMTEEVPVPYGRYRPRLTPVLALLLVFAGWAFLAFYATAGVKP